ncbi:antibiotic biosynthesis monooxygenase [Paenibacillus sp. S150]|uniref:antibiotic biosynthesis monooxygenase n=1 Tax=Paenibacillus sp. S150 TaxID=2749826 RepID=UPI001C5A376D|nr:antibiotic biosynthesis monooxygenase [Paenibacillus sp. S150]MBW4082176.1 antibiotic biosynthesis monooxygenase [Paenibacillus sp. S150]
MIVVTNTIKVKEGHADALASRFGEPGGVQDMPGFIRLEVWHGAPKDGAEELKICTTWENEEAFKGWTSSPAFRGSHRGAGKNENILGASLDKYELLISRNSEN